MPIITLYADYDRNGVLTESAREHQLAMTAPGAVVIPNIDVDARGLPATVSTGKNVPLDYTIDTKQATDNDLLRLRVVADKGTDISLYTVELSFLVHLAAHIRIYDKSRIRLVGKSAGTVVKYALTFQRGSCEVFLEAASVIGSPLLAASPGISPFKLTVSAINAAGVVAGSDEGLISVAPLLLSGDQADALNVFMCEMNGNVASLKDNVPGFTEVKKVVSTIRGVSFTPIPAQVHQSDTWIQDQIQFGYLQGSDGQMMQVVLHLPRLRADGRMVAGRGGLASLASDYFPSKNLGVIDDFWNRQIPYDDVDSGQQSVSFEKSMELALLFGKINELSDHLIGLIRQYKPASLAYFFTDPNTPLKSEIALIVRDIRSFGDQVKKNLSDVISELKANTDRKEQLDRDKKVAMLQLIITDIDQRITNLLRVVTYRSKDKTLVISITSQTLAMTTDDVEMLNEKLDLLHSSHNYGGNIEVTPPLTGAPLGKILFGNKNSPVVDPELETFFQRQLVQPLLSIDTSWLKVGHVDEVVNFIPAPATTLKYAVVIASIFMADLILKEIYRLNTADLNENEFTMTEPYDRPLSTGDLPMARGPHPVTKLLRGKQWLHSFLARNQQGASPPELYKKMSSYYFALNLRPYYPHYWPEMHAYDAAISVRELLYFSQQFHQQTEENLFAAYEIMRAEVGPNVPILELPVFFDDYDDDQQTIAFTPDLVNFQTVNGHLLVPRPYGPRMQAKDAITVLKKIMDEAYHKHLNEAFIKKHQLNKTFHWTPHQLNVVSYDSLRANDRTILVTLRWLAEAFGDGFFPSTNNPEEIQKRIRQSNAGKFMPNGDLKPGWHQLDIPENKVDVFELYTKVILEAQGVKVHFVDSWFYHVRDGGIHCGTNVLRKAGLSAANAWWKYYPVSRAKTET